MATEVFLRHSFVVHLAILAHRVTSLLLRRPALSSQPPGSHSASASTEAVAASRSQSQVGFLCKILIKGRKLDSIAHITGRRIHKSCHFCRVLERSNENTVVPGVKAFVSLASTEIESHCLRRAVNTDVLCYNRRRCCLLWRQDFLCLPLGRANPRGFISCSLS